MTVIDKTNCRKAEIIDQEIQAMQALVDRRWMWLNKAENKLKRTYNAVLRDTREMEQKIADLMIEKAEIAALEKIETKQTV